LLDRVDYLLTDRPRLVSATIFDSPDAHHSAGTAVPRWVSGEFGVMEIARALDVKI
jgi:hypothetical protein